MSKHYKGDKCECDIWIKKISVNERDNQKNVSDENECEKIYIESKIRKL